MAHDCANCGDPCDCSFTEEECVYCTACQVDADEDTIEDDDDEDDLDPDDEDDDLDLL